MKNTPFLESLLISSLLFMLVSCGSAEKKDPTPEVRIATKAFELSNKIKDSFINKDSQALQSLCSEALYTELSSDVETFTHMKLEFTLRWVDIDNEGTIHLYVSWERSALKEDRTVNDSGMSVFLIKGKPLVAENILRENPFK